MSGRLLSYSPATKKATVLRKGFWFANGCALAHDESYILVADTIAAQIVKFHLQGKQVVCHHDNKLQSTTDTMM